MQQIEINGCIRTDCPKGFAIVDKLLKSKKQNKMANLDIVKVVNGTKDMSRLQ